MQSVKAGIAKVIHRLTRASRGWQTPSVTQISFRRDPFQVLISTLLSLRTKDEVTLAASERLFKVAKTPRRMLRLREKRIARLIYPVGFYKTKAKRIREICKVLLRDYRGKVPSRLDDLLKLKGVGRKTANLVLTLGFRKLGICVDTHVHRISNRLGLVKTKTPEQTEFALRKILPKKYWIPYNDLLVAFGQTLCRPISPWCSRCPVERYCEKVGVTTHR
jgi:endonuclease-3